MPGATAITSKTESRAGPDPVESLEYVRAMLAELRTICVQIDEDMLVYLIEMAMLEAAERDDSPPPSARGADHRATDTH